MKKFVLLAVAAYITISVDAQIKMPAPSPSQNIVQDFGLGKIELSYSRPSIKGRKIFKEGSELVPLNNVWRTGANSATTLKFTDNVIINGVSIAPGKYGLLSIPEGSQWILIVTKDTTVTSPSAYKQENDVVRVTVNTSKMKTSVETFTMQFANIKAESCELHLMWGKTAVSLPIETNVKDRIRTQTEQALAAEKVSGNTYYAAANFYYEFDRNYSKALTCVTKAIEMNPKFFWMYLLKAKIEKALGDKVSAKQSAEKCKEIAAEQKNTDYVRMSDELIKGL
jgi:hypothetical protein